MSEMIDRVARALIDADPTMDGYHETHIAAKRKIVIAAIGAMREPTEEMFLAADDAWLRKLISTKGRPGDVLFTAIWQAMIDTALDDVRETDLT